jgi:cytoskeleton protein RodZ
MKQTIGKKLKAAREKQRLSLEKVFEATRIRVPYLQALEDDDLSSMPSPVQARGYLRNYAEFLGLSFDGLLEELRSEIQTTAETIGPADSIAEAADQPPAPLPIEEAPPLLQPEPDSAMEIESQPKPLPDKLKRRGRKSTEPELQPIPVAKIQPEIMEEPVPRPEPVVGESIETKQQEMPSQPDISEDLWQKWLNRLSSVLSVRMGGKAESRSMNVAPHIAPESLPTENNPPLPGTNHQQSAEIFKEIGVHLRQRREMLSLNLEDVERNTRVKAHYLDALERGAMDKLPSTVQTRGMLSNYAAFLDLDVDALLLRFADGLQARHREKNPQRPVRKPGQPILSNLPALGNFIAGDLIFGVGMAVLLVGFAIWGINRVVTLQSLREIQPTAPSISDILLSTPDPSEFTATPTFLPVESIPGEATAAIIIPTQNVNARVQVNLIAVERAYLRVVVDGRIAFDGRVAPGGAYPFEAEDQIEILVGSGTALRVVYNGRELGLLGAFGQVVNNIYTANEIITPTALPTVTFTITVPPTATSRPTNTLVPTRTSAP